jgi:hypothetical protein
MWNVIEMVAWKKISRNDSWTGFLICHNKFTKFTIFFATYWLLPTWWALHIRSKSCLFKNLLTTSPPNVNDTPLSFSPHPCTSLSGSDHNKSHNKPAIQRAHQVGKSQYVAKNIVNLVNLLWHIKNPVHESFRDIFFQATISITFHISFCSICDKVCQWLAIGLWFSPGILVSSTNKIDHNDITEILLKVALNTITNI